MANEARFEVYPQISGASDHTTDVDVGTAYHPSGDEYTLATATCEKCEWKERGDEADVRDAAASHERAHPLPTGDFGWRFRSANGQISAIGGEGFSRREDAHRAVSDFKRVTGIGWDQQGDPFDPATLDVDE